MSKIVMANIKMPISVENGKLIPMSEYIKITVEKCDVLPEKNQDNDTSLMSQIDKILSQKNYDDANNNESNMDIVKEEPPNQIMISLEEIKNQRPIKTRQNISFKSKSNRSKPISNFTMKNRTPVSSSSNTLDADHSLQQEVEE